LWPTKSFEVEDNERNRALQSAIANKEAEGFTNAGHWETAFAEGKDTSDEAFCSYVEAGLGDELDAYLYRQMKSDHSDESPVEPEISQFQLLVEAAFKRRKSAKAVKSPEIVPLLPSNLDGGTTSAPIEHAPSQSSLVKLDIKSSRTGYGVSNKTDLSLKWTSAVPNSEATDHWIDFPDDSYVTLPDSLNFAKFTEARMIAPDTNCIVPSSIKDVVIVSYK
jgi:hypothetical protein